MIGRIMGCLRDQKGKCGRFCSAGVYHVAERHRDVIDLA